MVSFTIPSLVYGEVTTVMVLKLISCRTGKGKAHPRTVHEGPEGEYIFSSTLSLSSAPDGDGCSKPRPGLFTPEKYTVPIV